MKRLIPLIVISVLLTTVTLADQGTIQIAVYPYYHDPATAWRLTVFSDGSVSYEESVTPVEVPLLTPDYVCQWASPVLIGRLSPRKLKGLHSRLRGSEISNLEFHYSASYHYVYPQDQTLVKIEGSEDLYYRPSDVHRFVTHGDTIRLTSTLPGLSADTSVYAPMDALEYSAPPHPQREAIARILSAWYFVLKATGPVNGYKAKYFRAGLK